MISLLPQAGRPIRIRTSNCSLLIPSLQNHTLCDVLTLCPPHVRVSVDLGVEAERHAPVGAPVKEYQVDQRQFVIKVDLAPGTRLEVTDRVIKHFEDVLLGLPEIDGITVNIGSSEERSSLKETAVKILGSHQAQIMINLKKLNKKQGIRRSTQEVIQQVKTDIQNKPTENAQIEYIAEEMHTNVRELEGAMLKLIAYSSISKSKITVVMAKEVLAEHISRTDPIVHLSDIESSVARFFGITTADIHSSKKDRTVSMARSFSMHLARKYTKMSYPEIGRLMGGKNHATVILANRKIEDLVSRNAEVRWVGPGGNRIEKAKSVFGKLRESISS